HLRRIYDIWDALYARKNRCCRLLDPEKFKREAKGRRWSARIGFGPLKMEVRKRYFAELLDIQAKAGVTLVTAEDIAFIHKCWQDKRYPRGWGPEDELVVAPDDTLFAGEA